MLDCSEILVRNEAKDVATFVPCAPDASFAVAANPPSGLRHGFQCSGYYQEQHCGPRRAAMVQHPGPSDGRG